MSTFLRLKPFFWGAAVLGLALCAPGLFKRDPAALHGYLIGLLYWTGLSLGCLGILMVNHTAGGRWGLVIRRPLEAAAATLPLCALLFLPLLIGAGELYPWAKMADDHHVHKIVAYLNVPFFTVRFFLYFAVWIGLTAMLRKQSLRQDEGADTAGRMSAVSAPGLLIFVITTTFAFTDWMMSLEPKWYSTLYGAMVLVGFAAGALAFVTVVGSALRDEGDLKKVAVPDRFHQLGNLLFAFVMLWTYLSFSQFLLIWSANLAEEAPWVIRRTTGGWQWVVIGLALFHFAAPFFILLSRQVKRKAAWLAGVAGFLLVVRWFDLLWLVAPALRPQGFSIQLTDIASTVGIGGLWLAWFATTLASRRLVPVGDPEFPAEAS